MALKRPSLRAMGVIGLVVALAFTTTVAVREWHRADHAGSGSSAQRHEQLERNDVAAAASGLARALYTYDYRDLTAAQHRIAVLATGGFAQREAAQAPTVQAQLRKAKGVSSAEAKETTVSEVSGNHATAFVVLQTTASSNGGAPATNIVYLHLDLVQVGAAWKVDDVQKLADAGA